MISRISKQKKNKDRYNIFVTDGREEKYLFSVNEDLLIKFHLKKGMKLAESEIEKLLSEENVYQSYLLAIRFLNFRMRSIQEVHDYLLKKSVDQEHITIIIDRLMKENLLNDKLFAESYVRDRMRTTEKGPILIKHELKRKGITNNVIESAIEQYTFSLQYDNAMKWVQKKINQTSKMSMQKWLITLQRGLMQKGFTNEVIHEVISNHNMEHLEKDEWAAITYHGDKLYNRYYNKLSGNKLKNKLKESLYRQGFKSEIINKFIDKKFNNV